MIAVEAELTCPLMFDQMPEPIPRVTIVGDGAMGTLCALLLTDRGTEVTMWSVSPQYAEILNRDRENPRFFPGYRLPEAMRIVHDAEEAFAFGPTLILSAVPCQFMRSVWTKLAAATPKNVPIVSVAKGLEVDTLLRPTDIIEECVGKVTVACLSGPSIAREVAQKKPATVLAASEHEPTARLVQEGFSTDYFRVYTSTDLLGVEVAGAVKNVIAIAGGICDGLKAGSNAKASLLTRGLVEITRLGVAMGASADTFRGLAGVGDLATTCMSPHSRNRTAGERIGRGATVEEAIAATESVIEGIPTTKAVLKLAHQYDVEMPIVEAIARVLFEGVHPEQAVETLMTRRLRAE